MTETRPQPLQPLTLTCLLPVDTNSVPGEKGLKRQVCTSDMWALA